MLRSKAQRNAPNMRDNQISKIVADTLKRDFDSVRIVDVNVRSDVDRDGDRILRIEVIFEGHQKDVNVRKLSAAVRHIRPKLFKIGEQAFPLISFISKGDLKEAKLEPA
jgi:hypothetical protein